MADTSPDLTKDIAFKAFADFFSEAPFIFFGTGLSCAVNGVFGMHALQVALSAEMAKESLSDTDTEEWKAMEDSLRRGEDLETALNKVNSRSLIDLVRRRTAEHLMGADQKYSLEIANGESEWPAGALIKKIVDKLSSSESPLHVLTPNYDLLFEHAMDFLDVPYTNGFVGCVRRRQDWGQADNQFLSIGRNKRVPFKKYSNHIRLYKVHGSLSYFSHRGKLIENHMWAWSPPSFAERVMITPGQSKFSVLQSYRMELQSPVDNAIDHASRFLFLGYGFNDSHLETYIAPKLRDQRCHALVLTKDSNPRIEDLARCSPQMWVITSLPSGASGCRIYNSEYKSPLDLPDLEIWRSNFFAREILGL